VPRVNPRIGPLAPTTEAVISAHARKTGATIEPTEMAAANTLGLTTQVPAQRVYRTDSFPRELRIGGHRIKLRTAGPRALARDAGPADLVIDALRAIGNRHVSDADIGKLRDFVRKHDLSNELAQRSQRVPAWMLPFIDQILKP